MQRLQPLQNPHFGSNIKIAKKICQDPFCKSFGVVLCKKTAKKNTKYSRNETILKIGHHAKAIAFANPYLGSKIKNAEKDAQNLFTRHGSCSMQEMVRKNS